MRYIRCKCGKSEGWTSGMPDKPCDGCSECNTTLESSKDAHREIVPHDFSFKQIVDTDEGDKELSRCKWCWKSKKELEKMKKSLEKK